jgi:hypothetical protein
MKRSRRHRPSPALVIACLALFVALGGTVLAATKIDGRTIRVKSLPGNRLAVGSLPGNRLKPGTIPGNRIAPRSIKGDQIDVTSLGQVPSAAHADSADTARHADTATAATHAADATTINGRSVGCPTGKREFAGACWDSKPNPAALSVFEAAAVCAAEGGELPQAVELLALAKEPGIQVAAGSEWTNQVTVLGEGAYTVVVTDGSGAFGLRKPGDPQAFRCVVPLLH